jgi:hypothetical protein
MHVRRVNLRRASVRQSAQQGLQTLPLRPGKLLGVERRRLGEVVDRMIARNGRGLRGRADRSWSDNDWGDNDWGDNDWCDNDWGDNDWGDNDWGDNDWGDNDWGDQIRSDRSWHGHRPCRRIGDQADCSARSRRDSMRGGPVNARCGRTEIRRRDVLPV